jgi:hypothetical protein
VLEGIFNGFVSRPLRCINPDQEEYSGLIQLKDENGENISQHKFGITSLTNKRDLLQKDDCVVFKIDETSRAVEVRIEIVFCFTNNQSRVLFSGHSCSTEEARYRRFHQGPVWFPRLRGRRRQKTILPHD